MSSTTPVVTASGLTFAWPDGTPACATSTCSSAPAVPGLVGVNGAGKSTLRGWSPGCAPTAGHVSVAGEGRLPPQDLTLDVHQPVDGSPRRRVRAGPSRLRGSGTVTRPRLSYLDTIGDDLGRPRRASPSSASSACPRTCWAAAWAGVRRRGDPARLPGCCSAARTYCCSTSRPTTSTGTPGSALRLVEGWSRSLLVVSHDRELLERMDRIGDLRTGSVRWYGGGCRPPAAQVEAEQEAAREPSPARSDLRRQRTERVEAERDARDPQKVAQKAELTKGYGKALINAKEAAGRGVGRSAPAGGTTGSEQAP